MGWYVCFSSTKLRYHKCPQQTQFDACRQCVWDLTGEMESLKMKIFYIQIRRVNAFGNWTESFVVDSRKYGKWHQHPTTWHCMITIGYSKKERNARLTKVTSVTQLSQFVVGNTICKTHSIRYHKIPGQFFQGFRLITSQEMSSITMLQLMFCYFQLNSHPFKTSQL